MHIVLNIEPRRAANCAASGWTLRAAAGRGGSGVGACASLGLRHGTALRRSPARPVGDKFRARAGCFASWCVEKNRNYAHLTVLERVLGRFIPLRTD